jgi:Ca2+-binding RTX toxin-like protein
MSYPTNTILVSFAKRLVPRRGSANESTITTTLVIFDSQVADLPLLHTALLSGSIAHTIQPDRDPIDYITNLLTQTGATKLAIVAHGQPGAIQIGNGKIDRAMLEARSGLLQEWGVDSIALYACEVGADNEFVRRFAELTGAQIASSTSKVGAGNWELDSGEKMLSIGDLSAYQHTLTIFSGTGGNDSANAATFAISGFTGGTVTDLTDSLGDIFDGLDGDDFVRAGNANDTFYGGNGNDNLAGNGGFDIIFGQAGIDTIFGGTQNDTIFGGIGNDIISGDDGEDYLYGEEDNDTIKGGYGFDVIYGQAGNDIIYGEGVTFNALGEETTAAPASGVGINDTIFGGIGDDYIYGGIGADYLLGEDGDDFAYGGFGNDFIYGGIGADYLDGEAGNDYLVGQDGNDLINGGAGIDYIEGGSGNDYLLGGDSDNSDDALYGNTGNDELNGQGGNDFLDGGDGIDTLNGGAGNDVLFGGEGNDILLGENLSFLTGGNDYLYGGNGADKLNGHIGNDFLIGGADGDELVGGAGSDKFVYFAMTDAGDTILDFNPLAGGDKIDLSALFSGLNIASSSVNSNYLQFVQSGANTICQVDSGGTGLAFVTMATLSNVTATQLSVANGNVFF